MRDFPEQYTQIAQEMQVSTRTFIRSILFRLVVLTLASVIVLGGAPLQVVGAQEGIRCFAETGLCIRGRIRVFWEQNGGLPVFGFPITPQQRATIEGKDLYVQWFERHRIELHPHLPPPYDVQLGRLGSDMLKRRDRQRSADAVDGMDALSSPTATPTDDCRWFPETGFSVCGAFLTTWKAYGLNLDGLAGVSDAESLALFGLPLSNPRAETLHDGNTYVVQWFERARFEAHPGNRVQLGLLGSERMGEVWKRFPRFETVNCPFTVPSDLTIECGYLTVPENRHRPDGPMIQLAVARVPTRSPTPAPDPVVYLAGGPGSAALPSTVTFARGWAGFLSHRDLILIDQRGTGFSRPSLLCPELTSLANELLGRTVTRAEKVQIEVETALRCRDRFVREGWDMASYTSAASAADINDLRIALGYDQLNLFGISYGTRLALTIMRDYPATIRSAILDSVYPPSVNLFTQMPENLERSLRTLFRNCAQDPNCNRSYPELDNVFTALVAQLDANPVTLWPRDPASGKAIKVHMDGTELVSLMFRTFYDTQALRSLPQMIYDARHGNYAVLEHLQQRRLARAGGMFSHGMYFSVICSEEIAFTTEEEIHATRTAYPHLQTFFAGIPENTPEILRLCAKWQVAPPNPIENAPVVSDIPTLLLNGEYDPITPPGWGELAARTLSRSQVFTFPATGHAVVVRGGCPHYLIRTFLEHPTQPLDGSCVGL